MSELADALGLQPATVTGLVDGLVEEGLVERRDDPADRRIVRVALTEKGERGREQHRTAMRERLMDLLGDIGDEELKQIHSALAVLHGAAVRRAQAGQDREPTDER
jgi:DNA-binding MarR family transcriptional regulator